MNKIKNTLGANLKVGDIIDVWWIPGRDMITDLKFYYSKAYEREVGTAYFALNQLGMTIEKDGIYKVIKTK